MKTKFKVGDDVLVKKGVQRLYIEKVLEVAPALDWCPVYKVSGAGWCREDDLFALDDGLAKVVAATSFEFPVHVQPAPTTTKKVIFNPPATIVIWADGSKTVVKCMESDEYRQDVGLAMCFCKKMLGSGYKKMFKKWCREEAEK